MITDADSLAAKIDPKAIWPLIRLAGQDAEDLRDPETGATNPSAVYLTDGEMIMLRAALRILCRYTPYIPDDGDRDLVNKFSRVMEGTRHKIETILDLEFEEGQFAPEPPAGQETTS